MSETAAQPIEPLLLTAKYAFFSQKGTLAILLLGLGNYGKKTNLAKDSGTVGFFRRCLY